MKYFLGKTNKQISDARRRLNQHNTRSSSSADSSTESLRETDNLNDSCPSPVPSDQIEPPKSDIGDSGLERLEPAPEAPAFERQIAGDAKWRVELASAIRESCGELKGPHQEWAKQVKMLIDPETKPDITKPDITKLGALYDDLIERITGARSPESSEPPKTRINRKSSKGQKKQGPRKPPNRARRKAYAFARVQDLMCNSPKKLADMVTEPTISQLSTHAEPPLRRILVLSTAKFGKNQDRTLLPSNELRTLSP